jgi:predicted acetyltransferase
MDAMVPESVRLRPFRTNDEDAARATHEALKADDFTFLLDYVEDEPCDGYLERLDRQRRDIDLPDDRVPATFLAARLGDDLVGRVSIRHRLNDWLASYGGHIGYGVAPEHRRRGHAKQILCQALVVARAAGVDDVLVICDTNNVASARTIEACGGDFESLIEDPEGATPPPLLDPVSDRPPSPDP